MLLGSGGDGTPGLKGLALGIGVGKEHDLVVPEGIEPGDIEHREASGSEPNGLRKELRADYCGLFGFNDGDGRRIRPPLTPPTQEGKKMQTEEAAVDWEITVVAVMGLEAGTDPVGMMVVVTVTVIMVEHDLPVANLLRLVDLPEDDTAVFRTA